MIKSNGGVFGRNPTFQNVTVDGNLVVDGGIISTGNASAPTSNTVIGSGAGAALEAGGTDNTLVGLNAGALITTADELTAIGSGALDANTSGLRNTAVGFGSLGSNLDTNDSTAVGHAALLLNTAEGNTAVGSGALDSNTSGNLHVAVGAGALGANTTGIRNVGIGRLALSANTTGGSNVAIGLQSLFSHTNGDASTAIGTTSFSGLTSGSSNTAIGSDAGRFRGSGTDTLTNAGSSVFIGFRSRASGDSQTNQVVIGGANAIGDGSNTTVLGTTGTTQARVQGGTFLSTGANGQSTQLGQATQLLTGLTGATVTATNLIPANCILLGVTARVTTAITGATTFDIGDGTTANRFGDDVAIALNTTSQNCIAPALISAATNVVLTANGSNFTAGAVRVTAHFMTMVAPTS